MRHAVPILSIALAAGCAPVAEKPGEDPAVSEFRGRGDVAVRSPAARRRLAKLDDGRGRRRGRFLDRGDLPWAWCLAAHFSAAFWG
jgi:hypothetical protein